MAWFTGCPSSATAPTFGEAIYSPNAAMGFEIVATDGASTVLRILSPWAGAEKSHAKEVFIARDGEKAPEGFKGSVVQSSPRRVVCLSSSHIAYMDALGVEERVVGVSGGSYITNPQIQEGLQAGSVREIGYDANINYELIASLGADVAFIYGTTGENNTLTAKLNELGIPHIYMGEQTERTPLGKSEWIVAMGEIFDLREEAEDIFQQVGERYESMRLSMLSVEHRPKVMFNSPYKDVWFVPADDSYMVRLVEDAGGEYICKGSSSRTSRPISGESAYVWLSQADVWLHPNKARTLDAVVASNPKFASTEVVRQGNIYNCTAISTPAGGSDFWESGAVWADVVLADMIAILHPERAAGHTLHYYEKVSQEEIVNRSNQ